MGREHLLADAYLRVERPAEHIAEAEKVIEATADEFVSATVSYTEEEWDVERLIPDPPDAFPALRRIAILAGEVIYNLRAALDYLVFALAMQDSGPRFPGGSKFPRGTQFPMGERRSCCSHRDVAAVPGLPVDADAENALEQGQAPQAHPECERNLLHHRVRPVPKHHPRGRCPRG